MQHAINRVIVLHKSSLLLFSFIVTIIYLETFPFVDFSELRDLLTEAEQNQFPSCDLLDQLKAAVAEAEQCAQVATQLFAKKHKTR